MAAERTRRLAQTIFLVAALVIGLASVERVFAGDVALALYEAMLCLVGLLVYTIIRLGDLFSMIDQGNRFRHIGEEEDE